jgi:hypothetical protein
MGVLGKTQAWIEHEVFPGQTRRERTIGSRRPLSRYVSDDIAICGVVVHGKTLHRRHRSACVREHERRTRTRGKSAEFFCGIERHCVHDARTLFERPSGNCR